MNRARREDKENQSLIAAGRVPVLRLSAVQEAIAFGRCAGALLQERRFNLTFAIM
jgi:hypothetical protein